MKVIHCPIVYYSQPRLCVRQRVLHDGARARRGYDLLRSGRVASSWRTPVGPTSILLANRGVGANERSPANSPGFSRFILRLDRRGDRYEFGSNG